MVDQEDMITFMANSLFSMVVTGLRLSVYATLGDSVTYASLALFLL